MKKPDRFTRLVEWYVVMYGLPLKIDAKSAVRLFRREHQAVKRKVMEMRNKDCKDKDYFYLLACDQILNWLEAREE